MSHVQNDEPVLHDRLGRQNMVASVGDEVAQCSPPCVFGIHGEWGSGKTSFLHQLHWYLTGDCPQQTEEERQAAKKNAGEHGQYEKTVTVVWFEAWRYQHEKDPVTALLHEIRTQLPLYSKWLNGGKKLAEVAIRSALLSIEDLTKRIGIAPSKIQEAGEQWERNHLAVALPSHTIRQHLNEALDRLLGKKSSRTRKNARLVVLIDDLDRCEPVAAFKLLEGIKIYLNLPNCVFVLGMNQRIIERAIAKHTALDEPQDVRHEYACEYLDKLCTNIWHLPLIDNPATPLDAWLPRDLSVRDVLSKVVKYHRCLAANPRKIKSFTNVLLRFVDHLGYTKPLSDVGRDLRHAQLIVFCACLYHDHHKLYRMIESDGSFYDRIYRWATGLEPSDPETKQPHELLCSLRLPMGYRPSDEKSEQEPTPTSTSYESFPDPVRGNVFRLQSLVQEIGPLVTSELRNYLLSGTSRGKEKQSENQ